LPNFLSIEYNASYSKMMKQFVRTDPYLNLLIMVSDYEKTVAKKLLETFGVNATWLEKEVYPNFLAESSA
jgi:hypothetical protein